MFEINNLRVSINSKQILNGINIVIHSGEIHAIMGPNGAGKTTLVLGLMGHPEYNLKSQSARWQKNIKYQIDGKDMMDLLPEERAKHGLFISFQQPVEVIGVSFLSFLRTAYKALHPNERVPLAEFRVKVREAFEAVGLPEAFMHRGVNVSFSGGEKKRAEIAQLLVLRPKFAILDEIDSGLDIDSLRIVSKAIATAVKEYGLGILLITHYQRILHYLRPDQVHVLIDGKIRKSDGMRLVQLIEERGYAAV